MATPFHQIETSTLEKWPIWKLWDPCDKVPWISAQQDCRPAYCELTRLNKWTNITTYLIIWNVNSTRPLSRRGALWWISCPGTCGGSGPAVAGVSLWMEGELADEGRRRWFVVPVISKALLSLSVSTFLCLALVKKQKAHVGPTSQSAFAGSSSSLAPSLSLSTACRPLPRAVSCWTVASAVCVCQTFTPSEAQSLDFVDVFMLMDFQRWPLVWFSLWQLARWCEYLCAVSFSLSALFLPRDSTKLSAIIYCFY